MITFIKLKKKVSSWFLSKSELYSYLLSSVNCVKLYPEWTKWTSIHFLFLFSGSNQKLSHSITVFVPWTLVAKISLPKRWCSIVWDVTFWIMPFKGTMHVYSPTAKQVSFWLKGFQHYSNCLAFRNESDTKLRV